MKQPPATVNTQEFAERLRTFRLDKGFSLKDLSLRSRLSIGLLSDLERGNGNPSLTTMSQIASALEIQLGRFFPDHIVRPRMVRKSERKILEFSEPGLRYELLTPDLEGSIELLWIELPPLFSGEKHPFLHEGEEAGIVLKGALEVHIGDEIYRLKEGDSIAYKCNVPHWSRNLSRAKTVLLWAITPPSF